MARNIKTPGVADQTAQSDENKEEQNQTQQQADGADQSTDQEQQQVQEPSVEELQAQLAAAQAENNSLKGQLRRASTSPSENKAAPTEKRERAVLSKHGWTKESY